MWNSFNSNSSCIWLGKLSKLWTLSKLFPMSLNLDINWLMQGCTVYTDKYRWSSKATMFCKILAQAWFATSKTGLDF